jgi:hypothetical protein
MADQIETKEKKPPIVVGDTEVHLLYEQLIAREYVKENSTWKSGVNLIAYFLAHYGRLAATRLGNLAARVAGLDERVTALEAFKVEMEANIAAATKQFEEAIASGGGTVELALPAGKDKGGKGKGKGEGKGSKAKAEAPEAEAPKDGNNVVALPAPASKE